MVKRVTQDMCSPFLTATGIPSTQIGISVALDRPHPPIPHTTYHMHTYTNDLRCKGSGIVCAAAAAGHGGEGIFRRSGGLGIGHSKDHLILPHDAETHGRSTRSRINLVVHLYFFFFNYADGH